MFQAILNGKVHGIRVDIPPTPGSDWREWFRRTEDFPAAAVFTRLSCLPSDVLWTIIRASAVTIGGDEPPPPSAGWPSWNLALKDQIGTTSACAISLPSTCVRDRMKISKTPVIGCSLNDG